MKFILFVLVSFAFLGSFRILAQENIDTRFETFLTEAIANFPAWISAHNLDPSDVLSDSSPESIFFSWDNLNLTGQTFNRSYYGLSHQFSSVSVHSNLTRGTFHINCTFGSEADLHTGHYTLEGSRVNSTEPITGQGTFVKMGRDMYQNDGPQVEAVFSDLVLTEDGHLRYRVMTLTHYPSYFDKLILENLDAGEYEEEVKEVVIRQIDSFTGGRVLRGAFWDYLLERLGKTPIEEIIGEPWPPQTMDSSGSNKFVSDLSKRYIATETTQLLVFRWTGAS